MVQKAAAPAAAAAAADYAAEYIRRTQARKLKRSQEYTASRFAFGTSLAIALIALLLSFDLAEGTTPPFLRRASLNWPSPFWSRGPSFKTGSFPGPSAGPASSPR